MSSPGPRTSEMSSPVLLPETPGTPAGRPMPSSTLGLGSSHLSSQTLGTPGRRPRSDLGGGRGTPHRTAHLEATSEVGERTVIWGTDVEIAGTQETFRKFLCEFRKEGEADPFYLKMMLQVDRQGSNNVNLDCNNLNLPRQDDPLLEQMAAEWRRMYSMLVRYPQELIPIFDDVVNALMTPEGEETTPFLEFAIAEDPEYVSRTRRAEEGGETLVPVQVRPFNLSQRHPMRDLNPTDIDQLIAVRGMITRASNVIPDIKVAFFRCLNCNFETEVGIDRGRIAEPAVCENCRSRNTMYIVHNRSAFANKQMVKLQETPESIPEGETPHSVSMIAFDDLVDVAKPGDRVEITGIFRASAIREHPARRNIKSVYRTYIDVLHFKKIDARRLAAEDPRQGRRAGDTESTDMEIYATFDETDRLDEEEEAERAEFIALSQEPDIYEKLARSVAPSIWELDDIKKGLLCQLFGGVNKELSTGRFRGEINVLLCGDPGTSKSQLLQYIHKLTPRGLYTSGKGSSAVGLTAYVVKDPDSRELVLESGALVLSDRGICCIDEFDKMSDQTRSVLHEAMEQQTVSIAKAGIIATLNARTSILASANPRESRYNPKMSVVDNIDLPPTLLSRFDLIYLVLDKPNVETDRRLARHLISLYHENPPSMGDELSPEKLTKYITYAKQHVHPQLSDEACEDLVNGYVGMRTMGGAGNRKVISATTRQLESLIRLAESLARMRFSVEVTKDDVAEALRLMRTAMQQAAMDPRTGTIDMDLIATGLSTSTRQKIHELVSVVRNILSAYSAPAVKVSQLRSDLEARGADPDDLEAALDELERDDAVVVTGQGPSRMVRKSLGVA